MDSSSCTNNTNTNNNNNNNNKKKKKKKKRGSCYCMILPPHPPPSKKNKSGKAALLHLKPLISTSESSSHSSLSISLEPNRPFTIGRSTRHCNLVFDDRRVSNQHCLILFDASLLKLYLLDGSSLNGVFVNGVRIGKPEELSAGDEVLLVCAKNQGLCCSHLRIGFIIRSIVFENNVEEDMLVQACSNNRKINKRIVAYNPIIGRAYSLLTRCRNILQSHDPILHLCDAAIYNDNTTDISSLNSLSKDNNAPHFDGVVPNIPCCNFVPPPGKNFYLNRLEFMHHTPLSHQPVVSLLELLYPVESLSRLFIATFTSDILWFLSYCEIPFHLPVTIACHNTERCWRSGPDKRSSIPYPEFPNLVVVYPPFPEAIAFGKDCKKQGIACHHPKLLVLQRQDSIRVIITSANLVANQWNRVTNTVWWQDFPRTSSPDYSSLFSHIYHGDTNKDSKPDFAAQLAGFMASLLTDVPSQAHWIVELTKYDFGGAKGHLIASVPGIHSDRVPSMIETMQFLPANQAYSVKFLGLVEASVVGLSHLFQTAADSNGAQLKKLAAFLRKSCEKAYGVLEILLIRNKNVPADANAVSVFVPNPNEHSKGDCVQLGFLPRNVAKWVSPLWDIGFFRFSGYVCPKEALAAALGRNSVKVQLILHVSQGPHFQDISRMMQPEHVIALCSLIASVRRCSGLWRLQEVLGQYRWPESLESDFIYGASSIGSSMNSQFLAAFSAASGKRSLQSFESEESDPEWGCWSASQESKCPSIRIIFPTIERVKNACNGILPSKRILCFSERTWQRLRTANILHDAVPHPHNRVGHPMHVKVARRRFQSKMDAPSSGWVYCGSHNFSAAAWGRPISNSGSQANRLEKVNSSLGLRLHICNYELGIIFIFPPTETKGDIGENCTNLDDVVLPYVVPAPKYGFKDRPATMQAMREALAELTKQEREKFAEIIATKEMVEEILDEEEEEEEAIEETSYVVEEKEDEKAYAEQLWSQVDSSPSC